MRGLVLKMGTLKIQVREFPRPSAATLLNLQLSTETLQHTICSKGSYNGHICLSLVFKLL